MGVNVRRERGKPNGGWLALAFLLALVGLVLFIPRSSVAQPADVRGWSDEAPLAPLPDLPPEYRRLREGSVTWVYRPDVEERLPELRATHAKAWPELEADLGQDVGDEVEIRIAASPEELRALVPGTPRYAVGVAIPSRGLIGVSLTAPASWEPSDAPQVLVHELSHVALRRAVAGRPLPRWFVEGVAIEHAEEHDLARFRTLFDASGGGRLHRLRDLDASFPHDTAGVSLAYAQAASLVRFLRAPHPGPDRFPRLVSKVREGAGFEAALRGAYGWSLVDFERTWREDVEGRTSSLAWLLGGGTPLTAAAFLAVWAWRKRRRRHRERLEEMDAEEREREEAIARAEAAAEVALREAETRERDAQLRVLRAARPRSSRELGVPTVEHDGENHTLH
ncbi:MAG: peptidase MA family metallohydrolase [Myxococcota bacterium]